jgi:hypothetical protein
MYATETIENMIRLFVLKMHEELFCYYFYL